MAKGKKKQAGQGQGERQAPSRNQPAAQEPVFGVRESAIVAGTLVIVGFFLPWSELGLGSYSGLKIVQRWDDISPALRTMGIVRALPLALPLLGVLVLGYGIGGMLRPDWIQTPKSRTLAAYGFAIGGALAALTFALRMMTKKLIGSLVFGFWIETLALAAVFLLGMWLLRLLDQDSEEELEAGPPWYSTAAWLAALTLILIVNYTYVCYETVVPAPEYLGRIMFKQR